MSYQPIEDYGIIGDLHTVALVGRDGSIDFMSFPHFDSPTIFAAILDDEKGGRFELRPVTGDQRNKQLYFPDTNILITRFLSESGVGELIDYMPIGRTEHAHDLVRWVKTVRGNVKYRMICAPKFDYARADHKVEKKDGEILFTSLGDDKTALRLRTSVPVEVEIKDGAAVAVFELSAGQGAHFILEQAIAGKESPSAAEGYVERTFQNTLAYWRGWLRGSTYNGRWREVMHRSALTLKLMTSKEHGSIVAAATFGLPEEIGGERNWDYRYTWVRDASFTLYGLIRLGYTDEAASFMNWIEKRCGELNPDGSLQIMYGLDGRHELTEV